MKKHTGLLSVLVLSMIGTLVLSACGSAADKGNSGDASRNFNYLIPNDEKLYTQIISEEVHTIEDVVFDEEKQLKMDVYMPGKVSDMQGLRPSVVLMHGGGLVKGDKKTDELTKSLAGDLAKMGYVTFDVNYTLSKTADRKAMMTACGDIANAVRYISANAKKYGTDERYIWKAEYIRFTMPYSSWKCR